MCPRVCGSWERRKRLCDPAYVPLREIAETKSFLITPNVIPGTGAQSEVGRASSQTVAWLEQPHVLQLCLWDQMQWSRLAGYDHNVLIKGSVKKENVEVKLRLLFSTWSHSADSSVPVQFSYFHYNSR